MDYLGHLDYLDMIIFVICNLKLDLIILIILMLFNRGLVRRIMQWETDYLDHLDNLDYLDIIIFVIGNRHLI